MTWDFPETEEELMREVLQLATEVRRDLPEASPSRHLFEAMRRSKGRFNPSVVRRALATLSGGADSEDR